jgi:hypothetical protein
MGSGSFRVDERRHGQLVPARERAAASLGAALVIGNGDNGTGPGLQCAPQRVKSYSEAVASLLIAAFARRRSVNQIATRVSS